MALLKGTLDVLVLKTLSWTPMHAFEITNWPEPRTDRRIVGKAAFDHGWQTLNDAYQALLAKL